MTINTDIILLPLLCHGLDGTEKEDACQKMCLNILDVCGKKTLTKMSKREYGNQNIRVRMCQPECQYSKQNHHHEISCEHAVVIVQDSSKQECENKSLCSFGPGIRGRGSTRPQIKHQASVGTWEQTSSPFGCTAKRLTQRSALHYHDYTYMRC